MADAAADVPRWDASAAGVDGLRWAAAIGRCLGRKRRGRTFRDRRWVMRPGPTRRRGHRPAAFIHRAAGRAHRSLRLDLVARAVATARRCVRRATLALFVRHSPAEAQPAAIDPRLDPRPASNQAAETDPAWETRTVRRRCPAPRIAVPAPVGRESVAIGPRSVAVDPAGAIDRGRVTALVSETVRAVAIDRSSAAAIDLAGRAPATTSTSETISTSAAAMSSAIVPVGTGRTGIVPIGAGAAEVGPAIGTTTASVHTTAGTTAAGEATGEATGTRRWLGVRSAGDSAR